MVGQQVSQGLQRQLPDPVGVWVDLEAGVDGDHHLLNLGRREGMEAVKDLEVEGRMLGPGGGGALIQHSHFLACSNLQPFTSPLSFFH